MKTPAQVVADVDRYLTRTWAKDATDADGPPSWPHRFPLGTATGAALADSFSSLLPQVRAWREWAARPGVTLEHATRRVQGTDQQLPTHLVVDDEDTAARVAGNGWPDRLARGRQRAAFLAEQYPHLERADRTLVAVTQLDDVDFDLLTRAAAWFANNPTSGLTPRQVPIEGLHAKWLNTRHKLLRDLTGLDDLGLAPDHPSRIHFTYLDEGHLSAGGRRHDSVTVGDQMVPAYRPSVVLISENKDTAVHFPPVPGGIAVEGNGRGARAFATFDWLRDATCVVYWGDMDVDGLEILNEFRAAGIDAKSMFMDTAAFDAWSKYGTDVDKKGTKLVARPARPVPHLVGGEADLYERLLSPAWEGPRRVEQERIDLATANLTLLRLYLTGS